MSSNDNKDFIDKIFDFLEPYKKSNVRFLAVIISFILFFILGLILSPQIIKIFLDEFPFEITLLQISPLEILFNYIKIAIIFSTILTFPIGLYQFGKLKAEKLTFDFKLNLLIAASAFLAIALVCSFVVYKFILPFLIFFLYGLNFGVSSMTASLSAMVSTILTTLLFLIILVALPFIRIMIKKSMFFNYATLVQFKKPIMIYAGIFSALLVVPMELLAMGIIFSLFVIWYKILVGFSKKRD